MRANIKQRRAQSRTPFMQAPEAPKEESPTGSNGVDAPASMSESATTEPSLPVNPAPELVQAVVQLMQTVEELKQTVQALSQRGDMETQSLLLKARISALERAVEVIPPLPPDTSDADTIAAAVVNIKAVATDLFPWLCRAGKDLPDPQALPPQQ